MLQSSKGVSVSRRRSAGMFAEEQALTTADRRDETLPTERSTTTSDDHHGLAKGDDAMTTIWLGDVRDVFLRNVGPARERAGG